MQFTEKLEVQPNSQFFLLENRTGSQKSAVYWKIRLQSNFQNFTRNQVNRLNVLEIFDLSALIECLSGMAGGPLTSFLIWKELHVMYLFVYEIFRIQGRNKFLLSSFKINDKKS